MEQQDLTRSPCVGLCTPATDDEPCQGCGRSLEEVINWHAFDDETKIRINKKLQSQHKKLTNN